MKPVAFDYYRPDYLDEALGVLAEYRDDAAVLAGGMSLGPMLNMRLVRPKVVVDINGVCDFLGVKEEASEWQTGALVRQNEAMGMESLAQSVPLLFSALLYVGHYQTRHRGTLVGSVAHADPAAEIPLCLAALDGAVDLASQAGRRRVPAREFFLGVLTTERRSDELITGLTWPKASQFCGSAFREIARRDGDYAIAAAACRVELLHQDRLASIDLFLGGIEDRPVSIDTLQWQGEPIETNFKHDIAAEVDRLDPMEDRTANAQYRRALARMLAAQVVSDAILDARQRMA